MKIRPEEGLFIGKFTKLTQINCLITRMTHIFWKLLKKNLVEIALTHSSNKKILPKWPYYLIDGIFVFKKINLSTNKSVYKICVEKKTTVKVVADFLENVRFVHTADLIVRFD